jgi:hypothetical protein
LKTLNDLIVELLELQKQGKGEYCVRECTQGEDVQLNIDDCFKDIFFE